MPLNRDHPNMVVFVCAQDLDGTIVPIGTGFLVGLTGSEDEAVGEVYIVTAKHVVSDRADTWIRFRQADGIISDVPVHQWVTHKDSDVAVTPVDIDLRGYTARALSDRFWCC